MSNLPLLATICLVAMLSPGPDFILVTKNALSLPKPQALATAFGIVAGCLFHATYCILGLALLITQSVLLFSAIKYAGAVYLIYLGVKGLFSKPSPEIFATDALHEAAALVSVRGAFVQGLLCNLLNPKLAVFLLSLFTQFISRDATVTEKAAVAGIFVSEAAIYWPLLVMALHSRSIRHFFSRSRLVVDRLCGILLLGLGLRIAVSRD